MLNAEQEIVLLLPKKTVAAAGRMAIERGIDPKTMVEKLLEAILSAPDLAMNLLDDLPGFEISPAAISVAAVRSAAASAPINP